MIFSFTFTLHTTCNSPQQQTHTHFVLKAASCVDCLLICAHIYIFCAIAVEAVAGSRWIFLVYDTNTLTNMSFVVVFCGGLFIRPKWIYFFKWYDDLLSSPPPGVLQSLLQQPHDGSSSTAEAALPFCSSSWTASLKAPGNLDWTSNLLRQPVRTSSHHCS